jgi:hypothetical protein
MAGGERSVIVSACGTGGNRSGRINQRLPSAWEAATAGRANCGLPKLVNQLMHDQLSDGCYVYFSTSLMTFIGEV